MPAKQRVLRVALAAVALPLCNATADVIHVPDDFPTIQEAIDDAFEGDVIIVAPGTYNEAIDFLGKAVHLRSSDGRDATTIDATDLHSSVVTCARGEGIDTILEGFTITGGTGTRVGNELRGGGMYVASSSPSVMACRFTGNTTSRGAGCAVLDGNGTTLVDCEFTDNEAFRDGGGLYTENSAVTITGCSFRLNSAGHYAGAAVIAYNSVIVDSLFEGNSSVGDGGALLLGSATIDNCTFRANSSQFTNGGAIAMSGDPIITNSTFSENSARVSGGAIDTYFGLPQIINCMFIANSAGSYGGAIRFLYTRAIVIDSNFLRNSAENGGGVANVERIRSFTNCTFDGNTAERSGGGMYNWDSRATLTNCRFRGNSASFGGGVTNVTRSHAIITNSTFFANPGGGIFNGGTTNPSNPTITNCIMRSGLQIQNISSEPTVSYSNIQGGYDGEGNIDADPLFVREPDPGPDERWGTEDDDYGDVRLQAGSPCIDAADSTAVPADTLDLDGDEDTEEPIPFDLDGNPRFVDDPDTEDTGRGACPIVDMGAFEFQADGGCCLRNPRWLCDGDVDGDGQVNPVDAGLVQAAFCAGEFCSHEALCQYDLDCNGAVEPMDSGIVRFLFGTCEEPRAVCR